MTRMFPKHPGQTCIKGQIRIWWYHMLRNKVKTVTTRKSMPTVPDAAPGYCISSSSCPRPAPALALAPSKGWQPPWHLKQASHTVCCQQLLWLQALLCTVPCSAVHFTALYPALHCTLHCSTLCTVWVAPTHCSLPAFSWPAKAETTWPPTRQD